MDIDGSLTVDTALTGSATTAEPLLTIRLVLAVLTKDGDFVNIGKWKHVVLVLEKDHTFSGNL